MLQLLVVAPPHETTRIRNALAPMGIGTDGRFVATVDAGLDALRERLWDAILLALPENAVEVSFPVGTYVDMAHGAPVVVIAGHIGEDAAVELVRRGAADVVSYARIERLPRVLERELRTKSKIASHQQESRTAYAWFASIVNNIPVGIVYHNERGEIVLCNETALALLGVTEDELMGLTAMDPRWNVIDPEGQPIPVSEHPSKQAARTKMPVLGKLMGVFRPKFNNRAWFQVDAVPVLDKEGRLAHVVIQFSDVTEQKRMGEALRASEERFRTTLDGTLDAVYWLDSRRDEKGSIIDFAFTNMNKRAEMEMGRSRDEVRGCSVCDMFPLTRQAGLFEHFRRVVETREPFENEYSTRHEKTNALQYFQQTILPIDDGVAVFNRNITERTRLQAQLSQAQKMEALGILAGGVAHDFNNILAAILCSADVLAQDLRCIPDSGEMPEVVSELQTAAHRGADLVRQILTFSRRAGQRKAPIKLLGVLQETIGLLRKTCPPGIEMQSTMRSDPRILADAAQMQQVLTNLCTNAFHAMEENGGILSISLDSRVVNAELAGVVAGLRKGPHAHIRITDTGPGMDANTLEHIFEPFFTTKGAGKGTGLGMAVVHGIVMAHDGAIRVQSAVGQGTEIDVWLPLAANEPSDGAPKDPPLPEGQSEHILIVDDEESLARIFGRLLRGIGYRATVYTNSAEALENFEKDPSQFHLAIVDLHMPAPGGVEVAKRMHELRPHLPIFIMSGYSDALGDAPPEELGITGILQKPISRETLAAELRKALDRQS